MKVNSLQDENGSVMIAALLVMALLTLIGTMSINNTTTELQIATNEIRHKQEMHCAETAAMVALKKVQGVAADSTNRHRIKDQSLIGFGTPVLINCGEEESEYSLRYTQSLGSGVSAGSAGTGAGNLKLYSVIINGVSGNVTITVECRVDF